MASFLGAFSHFFSATPLVSGVVGGGANASPKVLICRKSGKNPGNPGKMPNVVLPQEMAFNVCKKHMEIFVGDYTKRSS